MARRCCWASTAGRTSTACTRAKHDAEVEFYAFDMLVSDGEDLRKLPLPMRKTNLHRLLARRHRQLKRVNFFEDVSNIDQRLVRCRTSGWNPSEMDNHKTSLAMAHGI